MRSSSLICSFLIGVTMTSCNSTQNHAEQALRIHFPIVKLNLDPQKMEDAYSMAVVGQVHRGLFRYDMTGTVLPDLAESWTRMLTISSTASSSSPRPFPTGPRSSPVTCRCFRPHVSPRGFDGGRSGLHRGHGRVQKGWRSHQARSCTHISRYDEFRLARPSAIFLKQIAVADCGILRLTDYKQDPDLSEKGAFSGPFKVISPLKDNQLTIGRWRKDPMDSANPPEQITYFMTAEKPLVLAKAGTTDTLDHDRVVPEDLPDLQSKGWTATPTELSAELFVLMNPDTIPELSPESPARTSPRASVGRTSLRAATASDWSGSLSGSRPSSRYRTLSSHAW